MLKNYIKIGRDITSYNRNLVIKIQVIERDENINDSNRKFKRFNHISKSK